MNKIFCQLAPALLVLIFACLACGDDFKSIVIGGGTVNQALPKVHNDQSMVIRNFTQEGVSLDSHGYITVTTLGTNGGTAQVLSAAILDPAASPDIINSVVIAGPAEVSVTCSAPSGSNCFLSFKKDNN